MLFRSVSALSTACAAIALSIGWWPAVFSLETVIVAEASKEILHTVDIILVVVEIVVLLVMVLSFLGAGNKTANKAAHRWVHGSYAPLFWGGMIFGGLLLPEILYVFGGHSAASTLVAPVLELLGGLLLRFMVVLSDDRAPLPGEDRYYTRIADKDDKFVKAWTYGENIF